MIGQLNFRSECRIAPCDQYPSFKNGSSKDIFHIPSHLLSFLCELLQGVDIVDQMRSKFLKNIQNRPPEYTHKKCFISFPSTGLSQVKFVSLSLKIRFDVTFFVSGTFDHFNVVYKQHHRSALNPFLNDTKPKALSIRVNEALHWFQWVSRF